MVPHRQKDPGSNPGRHSLKTCTFKAIGLNIVSKMTHFEII